MQTKLTALVVALVLALSLTACSGGGKDMPMEVTVDGNTIVLGQTTMKEMTDWGYEAELTKTPDTAKDGDKFISFSYSLDKGAGNQFFVTVCVPWSGKTDISHERSIAPTEGIVKSVSVRVSSTEKIEAAYNGVKLKELTYEYAEKEWGAASEKKDGDKMKCTVKAKAGFVVLSGTDTFDDTFNELNVQLTQAAFDKMQPK